VLDEETDSAITFSRHVFFSGLYPLGGFRFTRDTAFCPLGTYGDRESFALDLTEEQQLRSGLFSPSVSFHYLTVRHWTTRAKLVWDLDDMTVLNGFDGEAERVVLRVGNKAYEANRVPAGGKAQLTELPTPVPGDQALVQLALNQDAPPDRFVLGQLSGIITSRHNQTASSAERGRATYVIVFSRPPVDLNAGLTMRGDNAFCVLFGESVLQGDTAR